MGASCPMALARQAIITFPALWNAPRCPATPGQPCLSSHGSHFHTSDLPTSVMSGTIPISQTNRWGNWLPGRKARAPPSPQQSREDFELTLFLHVVAAMPCPQCRVLCRNPQKFMQLGDSLRISPAACFLSRKVPCLESQNSRRTSSSSCLSLKPGSGDGYGGCSRSRVSVEMPDAKVWYRAEHLSGVLRPDPFDGYSRGDRALRHIGFMVHVQQRATKVNRQSSRKMAAQYAAKHPKVLRSNKRLRNDISPHV
jgi:hypothetical protein